MSIIERRRAGGADDPRIRLEIAAIRAAQGSIDEALVEFEAAYDAGYRFIGEVDPMFDPIPDHPTFERVMAAMRTEVEEMRRQVLEMEAELEAARVASGR